MRGSSDRGPLPRRLREAFVRLRGRGRPAAAALVTLVAALLVAVVVVATVLPTVETARLRR